MFNGTLIPSPGVPGEGEARLKRMMSRPQKIVTTTLWCLTVLGMLAFIGAGLWGSRPPQLPVLFALPRFQLLDQNGQPFTDQQLRGRPFVAAFVFTHCAGPCPMMFGKMKQ